MHVSVRPVKVGVKKALFGTFSEVDNFWSGRDLSKPSQMVVVGVVLRAQPRGIGARCSLHDLDYFTKVVSFGVPKIGDSPNFESRFLANPKRLDDG